MVVRECSEHGTWTAGCPICTDVLPQFEALLRVVRAVEVIYKDGRRPWHAYIPEFQDLREAVDALPEHLRKEE